MQEISANVFSEKGKAFGCDEETFIVEREDKSSEHLNKQAKNAIGDRKAKDGPTQIRIQIRDKNSDSG